MGYAVRIFLLPSDVFQGPHSHCGNGEKRELERRLGEEPQQVWVQRSQADRGCECIGLMRRPPRGKMQGGPQGLALLLDLRQPAPVCRNCVHEHCVCGACGGRTSLFLEDSKVPGVNRLPHLSQCPSMVPPTSVPQALFSRTEDISVLA